MSVTFLTNEDKLKLDQDISKLSEDIAEIKENGTGTGSGVTTAQANSLWAFLKKTAFTKPLTDAEINEFKTTWGITEEVEPDTPTTYTITRNLTNCTSSSEVTSIDEGSAYTETITANNGYTLTGATVSVTMGDSDITSSYSNGVLNISSVTGNIVLTVSAVRETTEPDNPEVTLTSISATYTGGNVTVGTSVTDLTGITVTGTYSDGSTSTITGYTLSGEIVEGSNTITVSYSDKTTTFTVVGVAESSGGDVEVTSLRGFQLLAPPTAWSSVDGWSYITNVATGNNYMWYTGQVAHSGEVYFRTLMPIAGTNHQYCNPEIYITADEDPLSDIANANLTKLEMDEDYSTFSVNGIESTVLVEENGAVSADSEGLGYVYVRKFTIPEGCVGVLTLGKCIRGTAGLYQVRYAEGWLTLFYEDPRNNITVTEVTE